MLPGQECDRRAEIACDEKFLLRSFEAQEIFGQGDDVFRTLAQRWNAELELAEAMETDPGESGLL